jgi:hypothetical protein
VFLSNFSLALSKLSLITSIVIKRAGFLPGANYIVGQWHPPQKTQIRIAIFYTASAASLSPVFWLSLYSGYMDLEDTTQRGMALDIPD